MKAAVFTRYGGPDVVELAERPDPECGPTEILVRTLATTVSAADWRIRSLTVPKGFGPLLRLAFGICQPRKQILGTELAGEVVAVGDQVSRFQPGDRVVASAGSQLGCHAEQRVFDQQDAIIPIPGAGALPGSLSTEQAACMSFGGMTALDFLLDKGKLQSGERVLVMGASGAVGSAAVQIATHYGADVTGVCREANHKLVLSLGATEAIDYTRQNVLDGSQQYDVILDAAGGHAIGDYEQALRPGGRVLLVVADMPTTLSAACRPERKGKRYLCGTSSESLETLQRLAALVEAGAYTPVIDRCYAFADIRQAHAYVDTGRKRGNVVVKVSD